MIQIKTNNGPQNITYKTKDWAIQNPDKSGLPLSWINIGYFLQELCKGYDKWNRICLLFRSISVHPRFALLKIRSLFVLCNIIFCPAIFGPFLPVWYLKALLNYDSPNNSNKISTTYKCIKGSIRQYHCESFCFVRIW